MQARISIAIIVFLLVLVAGYFLVMTPGKKPNAGNTSTDIPAFSSSTDPTIGKTMSVKIALLDTTGNGTGKARGCDTVTMASRVVLQSPQVLTAALNALFAEPEGTQPSTAYNFIARTSSTLKFDHATVENGTANIYLTGSLSGLAGVCDDPRAQIQLEETALQFPTVQKVQLFLNGKPTTLTPSEKGE